jgi:hypothetical protein
VRQCTEPLGKRTRTIEDVLRDDAPRAPSVDAETNLGAGPADSSSSPEIQNGDDVKDGVALAGARRGDHSRQCGQTSLMTPKKRRPPAGISRSAPKLSPKLMRVVLNSLRKYPVLWYAASKADIHRKTLKYWMDRSAAGDDGYDIKWQGIEWRFHEHCESAIDEAHQILEDDMLERALSGYNKVLTHRGRVVYKIDEGLAGLGCRGPDAYLTDADGNPIPETVSIEDAKAQLSVLKRRRAERYGTHSKIVAPRESSVLVVGDMTKKPKCNTDKKSELGSGRQIRERFVRKKISLLESFRDCAVGSATSAKNQERKSKRQIPGPFNASRVAGEDGLAEETLSRGGEFLQQTPMF